MNVYISSADSSINLLLTPRCGGVCSRTYPR